MQYIKKQVLKRTLTIFLVCFSCLSLVGCAKKAPVTPSSLSGSTSNSSSRTTDSNDQNAPTGDAKQSKQTSGALATNSTVVTSRAAKDTRRVEAGDATQCSISTTGQPVDIAQGQSFSSNASDQNETVRSGIADLGVSHSNFSAGRKIKKLVLGALGVAGLGTGIYKFMAPTDFSPSENYPGNDLNMHTGSTHNSTTVGDLECPKLVGTLEETNRIDKAGKKVVAESNDLANNLYPHFDFDNKYLPHYAFFIHNTSDTVSARPKWVYKAPSAQGNRTEKRRSNRNRWSYFST